MAERCRRTHFCAFLCKVAPCKEVAVGEAPTQQQSLFLSPLRGSHIWAFPSGGSASLHPRLNSFALYRAQPASSFPWAAVGAILRRPLIPHSSRRRGADATSFRWRGASATSFLIPLGGRRSHAPKAPHSSFPWAAVGAMLRRPLIPHSCRYNFQYLVLFLGKIVNCIYNKCGFFF